MTVQKSKQRLGLLAGIAWAAAFISSAAPANARVLTPFGQSGAFATCSRGSQHVPPDLTLLCHGGEFVYYQRISFINTACGAGGCSNQYDDLRTEFEYHPGRSAVTYLDSCEAGDVYGLDSCAC